MAQRLLAKRVLSTYSQQRNYCTNRISSLSQISNIHSFDYLSCRMPSLLHSRIISAKHCGLKTVDLSPLIRQRRCKTFRSTPSFLEASKEDKHSATPSEATDDDNEIPDFQNPIHHNDPDREKIMLEDFPEGEAPIVPLPPLDDGSGKVIAPPHLHDLADEIVGMTMLEVKELVDRVAEHFGIEEGDDDAFASGGDGANVEEEVVVAKTSFDLKLTGFDSKDKIKVIKEIRAITGLGLKEAKELVEGVPKTIKKDIKMEEAEDIKAKLEAVGATVEIE